MAAKILAFLFTLVVMSLAAMVTALTVPPAVPTTKVHGSIRCITQNKATPVPGATAKVVCDVLGKEGNEKPIIVLSEPTNKNGDFFISVPLDLSTGERLLDCKAFLINNTPLPKCDDVILINDHDINSFVNNKKWKYALKKITPGWNKGKKLAWSHKYMKNNFFKENPNMEEYVRHHNIEYYYHDVDENSETIDSFLDMEELAPVAP